MRKLSKVALTGAVLLSCIVIPVQSSHAAPACSPATSDSGGVRTLTFTNASTCTWTVPAYVTSASTILIVGGGGGAGYYGNAGGGGAGALVVTTNFALTPGATFDITAGTGGAGSTAGGGSSGTASSFGTVTATGGGAGAGGDNVNGNATRFNNGLTGGSGGGGSSYTGNLTSSGGSSNAATGITSPWTAFGTSGAGGAGNGGGGGGGADTNSPPSGATGGGGKTYFGNVYAKGGSAARSVNQLVAGSGNGGNVISTGGTGSSGSVTIQYTLPVPIFSYASSTRTTKTGVAFGSNSITSTGTPIASYSISPALPSGVTLDTNSGQLIGTPTALLNSTVFTVTATDAGGGTGTTSLTLSITAGPATVSINNISGPLYKGVSANVIATVNAAGKVRFFVNGKRISNCLAISTITSGSITATCAWKPTMKSSQILTATITPSGNTYTEASSPALTVWVNQRSTRRS